MKVDITMRRRLYTGIVFLSLVAGVFSFLLRGTDPFSWTSYFAEMYPFFFGIAVVAGLFQLVVRLPGTSLARTGLYWMSVVGTVSGCLVLCVLGLFTNPMNWKNYVDYTPFDRFCVPASNAIIVIVGITLAILMLWELRTIKRSRS